VLLSAVAWAGAGDAPDAAAAAFAAGAATLPSEARGIALRPADQVGFAAVDRALSALEHGTFGVRRAVLEACAEAAAHDGRMLRREAEMLRAVSESLDCPMPPLLGVG
jgi:hypothetical protein